MKRPAYLKEDVVAYNFQVRGKKGDLIYIRFKHDDVYIIENEKGNKFSVHKSKIDERVSDGDSEQQTENAPLDKVKGKTTSRGKG